MPGSLQTLNTAVWQDGLAPLFGNTVDKWSDEQFAIWSDYHLSVCSEKSIIDMSNHVIIVGRKK